MDNDMELREQILNALKNIVLFVLILSFATMLTACVTQKTAPKEKSPPKHNELEPKEVKPSTSNLDEVKEKAQKGLVVESPYNVIVSTMKQVKVEWGEPDKVDQAGSGYYATYNKKDVVLGYTAAGEIFDVRSYAKDLNEITYKMIEERLGKPTQVREANNETIYVYQLSSKIELKFIIPNNGNGVDHISIFNPERAVVESAKLDYILDIKGRSNQLSAQAWEKMQNWRKQVVLFSKGQENVYVNGPNKRQVALTFDDGPDITVTPAILDILDKYNVKGNFFFIGSKVNKHPEVVKNAYNKGNLVLSHTYNHVELTKLGTKEIHTEIDNAGKAIKSVIGKEPAILRPPYGDVNEQVAAVSREEGYSLVLWSIDTLDWSQKEAKNIVRNVMDNVRNGDIILMHSDSDKTETQKALPLIIEALQKKNFEIVDLETLLNVKAYQ
jgi:peptidoglycan/xylan/chitin deacetylase (PgdA/CDA1 family)